MDYNFRTFALYLILYNSIQVSITRTTVSKDSPSPTSRNAISVAKMSKANAPRRSRRLQAQKRHDDPSQSPLRIQKPQSKTLTSSISSRCVKAWLNNTACPVAPQEVDLDELEAELSQRLTKIKKETKGRKSLILDSASSSDNETNEDFEGNSEFEELDDLSADNLEWYAAHNISRHTSYDSRFEPGNEIYAFDDFVVPDDCEADSASLSSDDQGIASVREASSSSVKTKEKSRRCSSRLFYSDPDDDLDPLALTPSPTEAVVSSNEDATQPAIADTTDIVDEIMDALALFSRRCHRNRAPLRLRLAAAVLEDEEVRDALENAVRRGLGRKRSFGDGSKTWTIGPRS